MLLGVLTNLFVAPAYGFPIMSRGPNFVGFFAAIVGAGVALVLVVRALRKNRAVRVHDHGVAFVDGRGERSVAFRAIRALRHDARAGALVLEIEEGSPAQIRLSPPLAAAAAAEIRAHLPAHRAVATGARPVDADAPAG